MHASVAVYVARNFGKRIGSNLRDQVHRGAETSGRDSLVRALAARPEPKVAADDGLSPCGKALRTKAQIGGKNTHHGDLGRFHWGSPYGRKPLILVGCARC